MTLGEHPIGLRLRFEDTYIIVAPSDSGYEVLFSDALGRPVVEAERYRAAQFLLREIQAIRKHVYLSIGGKVS